MPANGATGAPAAPVPAGSGQGSGAAANPTVPGAGRPSDELFRSGALPAWGSERWFRLAAWGVTMSTTAGTVTAMALFLLRRRRDGGADVPPVDGPEQANVRMIAPHLSDSSEEDGIPRWRRPSLIAARKASMVADPSMIAAERLTFARTDLEPDVERERRWIRYRMVRLSDGPDELMSAEIGRLDAGDEVELLERSGAYWQVRTPTGHVGWVHRMTLGDVVAAESDDRSASRAPHQTVAEPVTDGLAARLIRERAAGA